ncbi:MAG TPA: ATP-binding cassette domain-containing protein [Candidatus Cloacimonadota bacterium]|nr:ATP-binding cassette domain-containing protein [Candidatus Cloacimonadota bacterium]HQL14293.1 ATP-binding cassette domain-containing protein [Candidatus Cloacimonadota bacterium]
MIEFRRINLTLNHKTILNNIDLIIPDDDKTVIIGRSGCGKTVLMKTLQGLYHPDSGSIIIDGEPLNLSHYNIRSFVLHKIAMLFQSSALLDSYTVFQNVALPLYEQHVLKPNEIQQIVLETLEFVGLSESVNLYPEELSGGMRKRIGLARALVTNPKYIILDEPTTGLDPFTAREVLNFLKQVIEEKQIIPVTITHDPYCINELGNYVVIMHEGSIIFQGDKREIKTQDNNMIKQFYDSFFAKAEIN